MLSKGHLGTLAKPFGFVASDLEFLQESQNIVYRVSHRPQESQKRIIRISKGRYRTKEEVESELEWIRFIAEKDINICKPVSALDGAMYHSCDIDGVLHLVTCFEHAPGI